MTSMNSRWALLMAAILATVVGCGKETVVRMSTPIRINEVNPDNGVHQDLGGGTGDWVELHNQTDVEFSLEGYYISDSAKHHFKDQFVAETVIPANGVLLVWTDAQPKSSSPREPHTSFNLSADGEGVWLSNPDGYVVDHVDFGTKRRDPSGRDWVSLQRFPDGTGQFVWCTESTPEALNGSACAGQVL